MRINFNNSSAFNGSPQRLQGKTIYNYRDALSWWEKLKSAKYLDVHDDKFFPSNKSIRKENYAFLDRLYSDFDKSAFVEKFCEFTKFPHLKATSDNIRETFEKTINNISRDLNNSVFGTPYKVLGWGYDPTCSLGLNKSFPGSDLDKGYIILEGNDNGYNNDEIANNFSSKLWDELDQRIVSLNHPDTYPSIYTKKQVETALTKLDEYSKQLENNLTAKTGIGLTIGLTIASLLGPLGIIGGCAVAGALLGKAFAKPYETTEPYAAAKFNREIAKIVPSYEREQAKNFAFFIETVRANINKHIRNSNDSLFKEIKESPFANNSNVNQIEAWQKRIQNGYMKTKLKNREKLESDFYRMDTDRKYELVKDIIKYSSDDHSGKFSEYFKNDDDIANRYQNLLNALK